MRYRLIKPDWGKEETPEGLPKISGKDIIEGDDFSPEKLKKLNEKGYNVYFFPNANSQPLDHKFLRGTDVDVFTCCYVDMDLKDGEYEDAGQFLDVLEAFECPPNRITMSGNGVHAYWDLDDLSRDLYVEMQLRLIQQFKTDKSVFTVLQLMRYPGYYNTKQEDNFKLAERIDMEERQYTIEELDAALPTISSENISRMEHHIAMLEGVKEFELANIDPDELPAKFEDLLSKNRKVQELWDTSKGGRSEADMSLANILYKKEFTRQEAYQVLCNTQKALHKGPNREGYAAMTVAKVYTTRASYYVPNASELKLKLGGKKQGAHVRGPHYFDCTYHGWRKKQLLGLIAGSGVGKTTITLDIFYEMIKNNPDNDDIFIFFTLEMGAEEIIERWELLTAGDPDASRRLYVIANEDENGEARNIGPQEIYWYLSDISKATGRAIGAVAIDHIGIIKNTIDVDKKPSFGLVGDSDGGFYGSTRTVSPRRMTQIMKGLAKKFNCFMVVQSQTTKAKAGQGDVPLGIDAAYGNAQFEWDMDYVMTVWQPLRRVEDKTNLRALAWQYAKIRAKHVDDKIKLLEPYILEIDMRTGKLEEFPESDMEEFAEAVAEADAIRKRSETKGGIEYKTKAAVKKLKAIMGKKREA